VSKLGEHGALGAGTAVDIDELWKMYAALPRAARVNRKLFRERWEGSLVRTGLSWCPPLIVRHGLLGAPARHRLTMVPRVSRGLCAAQLLHKSTKSAADDMDRSASADFVAGSMAGVAATVVGHPFDTIKGTLCGVLFSVVRASDVGSERYCGCVLAVRLQTRPDEFKGVAECLSQTVRKEGIRGLYKGGYTSLVHELLGVPVTLR